MEPEPGASTSLQTDLLPKIDRSGVVLGFSAKTFSSGLNSFTKGGCHE
jgi:hypothetical protein